jgi:hypothetical protein
MKNKNKKLDKTLLIAGFTSLFISSTSMAQVTTVTPNQAGTTQSFLGGTVTSTMPNYGNINNNNINNNQTQGKIANTLQNKVDTMSQPNYTSATNTIDSSVLVLADKFHGDLYSKYALEGYEKSLHNPGDFYNTYSIDYYTSYKKK